MDFAFKEIATLPKLAWALRVQRGAGKVLVEHGSSVEVRERFFCEGAWNGDFAAQSIESSILMGSGGKIIREGLLLACPSHPLDRISQRLRDLNVHAPQAAAGMSRVAFPDQDRSRL